MDKYVLDGQYRKYLEMIGVKVGEALKEAGVPEDLFSRNKPVLDEVDYYAFMSAVGRQVTNPKLPIVLASADDIESFSPPIFAATYAWRDLVLTSGSLLLCGMNYMKQIEK